MSLTVFPLGNEMRLVVVVGAVVPKLVN